SSLVQGTRRPFEELSYPNSDTQSNFAASSDDDSDEQDYMEDSSWEISASSDDESASNPRKESNPLDNFGGYHTTGVGPASLRQSTLASVLNQKPTLEMPHLLASIEFVVASLYEIPIRRPAPLDRLNQKASVEASYYQSFDILYVKDKFQHLDANVAIRLGKMITLRRQLLLYRLSHNQKLKTSEVGGRTAIENLSATKPSSPKLNNSGSDAKIEVYSSEKARSQTPSTQHTLETSATTVHNNPVQLENMATLYTPSIAESTSSIASSYTSRYLKVEVPPRPKGKDGKELDYFECPYCLVTKSIKNERAWKKHVLRDLQPYVCTHSHCDLSDQFFGSRKDWYEHESRRHRIKWFCNVDSHPHFAEQTNFIAHMKSSHNTTFDASKSSLLSSMFRCPLQSSGGGCNLCLEPTATLKNHVARHLEQVALFALPRVQEAAGDNTVNENDSIKAILSHEQKQLETGHSDSDNEQLLPPSVLELETRRSPISTPSDVDDKFENYIIPSEQQSEGSYIDEVIDPDIIPDSEETSWDMRTLP
ncbi:hypothetical protein MMC07_006699, partial [Pseudocyphellaria aurata]|nr:hypothetical protein [Pseudocyphellaria aurata]